MAWIESHQEMARHPKTRRVAVRLGISKAAVIGHLHLLWWWTLDFAPDGDLSGFDAEELAAVSEWEGDAEQFLQALLDTGWLDEGRRVHNWEDYAGRLVNLREENRERQRRCREKKRDGASPRGDEGTVTSGPRPTDVTPMSQLCHANVTVTSQLRHGATEPDQTEQNRTQPNRERVARGRASGPAERSAGVPSLSHSRKLVSEPAPVGGERPDGAGNALSRDGKSASSGAEARRGAGSVLAESAASGEAGRPEPERLGPEAEQLEPERSLCGAGNALPSGPEDRRRERREPGLGGERGAARDEGGLRGGRALLPDGGEFFAEDDGALSRERWEGCEGVEPGREEESISLRGEGCSLDDRDSSRMGGELATVCAEGRGAPSRGGGVSPGNRDENRKPLDGKGRALPGAGPAHRERGPGGDGRDLSPMDAPGGNDGEDAASGDGRWSRETGGGLRTGCDGVRLAHEVREALRADAPGVGGRREGAGEAAALPDDGYAGDGVRRGGLGGEVSSDGGGLSRDAAGFSSGGDEEIPGAGAFSSGQGEPGAGVSRQGGGSRPKVAALRVEGEFSPGAGAAREPGGRREERDAREALRQDEAFREAWLGWRQHLADLGRPMVSRGQERSLLRECARRGAERAMEVIAYSITRGARNLIWDDAPRAKRPPQPAAGAGRKPNPEGWLEWLAEEYPDRAGIAYADVPESVQGEFRRALPKTG